MTTNQKQPVRFTRRRIRNVGIAVIAMLLLAWFARQQDQSLQRSNFTTGYLLLGSLFFLAAFNLRKKLTFLPAIGTAATWMQLHIYVGLSTFLIFAFHIAWRMPSGMFETVLAALYLIVAFSGVYGLYVTRRMPARLTALKDEVIFERIPLLRFRLARNTRALVMQACESSDVLARFYANKLATFFEQPRSLAYLLVPSGRRRRQLVAEIQDLDRYIAEDQRFISRQLRQMVERKDDLDYHYAIQGRLKVWLFVHIGLTYSLLIVAVVHGVLAHSFNGGLP